MAASPRLLSFSEIDSAQTCWARHAFAYTGHLTHGDTLKRKALPRILSEGRAWGSAVARWHEGSRTLLGSIDAAEALRMSLDADELEQFAKGLTLSPEDRVQTESRLQAILDHHIATSQPLGNLSRLEDEVIVPIPSRTGRRSSSRYRFLFRIDGWTFDADGRPWLVEFKLRGKLTSVEIIQMQRQPRWYAWGLRKHIGIEPFGVLIDETLNEVPKPARLVQARKKGEGIDGMTVSHAVDQITTPELYLEACKVFAVEPVPATLEAIGARRWHQRVPIIFRKDELDEAGEELVSGAKLIRDLDSGELYPMRHVSPMACNGCRFKEICPNPEDDMFVDTLFERTVPKRDREPVAA